MFVFLQMFMSIKERLQLYPVVPLAVCLIVGILLGEHFCIGNYTLLMCMLGIVACVMLFGGIKRLGNILSVGLLGFFVLLGVYITNRSESKLDFMETGEYETFCAIVKTEPIRKNDVFLMQAEIVEGRLEGKTINLRLIDKGKDNVDCLGKTLIVSAKVRKPRNFKDSRFDYPLYLKSHSIGAVATTYNGRWKILEKSSYALSPIEKIKILCIEVQRKMVNSLRGTLHKDNQAFAVTAAMSLGYKGEISRMTSDVYSLAGTSHVLALSGLHLSIVFGLFALFGGRWRKSVFMVVLSVVTMWIYVFIAGLPVSMIRSAIMLTVSLLVGLSGRNGITLNTLSFSAIIILMINPFSIHDIGFQLSFAAVAFLGAFASDINKIIPPKVMADHRILRWCWQMCVTSIIAQVGTTPLVAYHFGRLPLLFLPANFIAIPAATIILYLTVFFFICLWLPLVSTAIGHLLSIVSSVLNASMTFIAQLRYSSLTIDNMSILHVILLYIVSIAILLILQRIRLFSSDKVPHSLA